MVMCIGSSAAGSAAAGSFGGGRLGHRGSDQIWLPNAVIAFDLIREAR